MRGSIVAFVVACIAGLGAAFAQGVTPPPGPGDPRIRVVPFNEDQIIALRGHLGYQMLVEFDPAERIENVAIGDSLGWQVTPNRAATLLFIKPITRGAATNMTVVTTLRRYSFELTAREATGPSDPNIIYTVRFRYPAPPAAAPPPAPPPPPEPTLADFNLDYTVKGGGRMPPVNVFDDGKATFFQFAESADAPAIFIIGRDGEEELVNSQWRGAYMVVDQIAKEFVLRIGRQRARITNNVWREPTPGPLTPPGAERRQP